MKKITALLLCTSLLFGASACNTITESSAEQSTSETILPQPTPITDITIDSSFVLILPSVASETERYAAQRLCHAAQKIGLSLYTQTDDEPQAANEIILGNTSRKFSEDALRNLSPGSFRIAVKENAVQGHSIVIAETDDDAVDISVEYFIRTYLRSQNIPIPFSLDFTHTPSDALIQDRPLSSFTVVYATEGVGGDKNIQAAKYKDTADAFVSLVTKATGVTLKTAPDTDNIDSAAPMILFGNTSQPHDNRIYTAKFSSSGSKAYAVKLLDSGNISLAGNNAVSTLAAGEAFVYSLLGSGTSLTKLDLTDTKDIVHVACIGDSITYGTNSTDPSMQSYPVYLQRMLGYNYYVEKYGAPSHSLIETDTPSFLKHEYFSKSQKAKPDVVIVMLGTNDCRTQRWEDSAYKNWNDPARKTAFLESGQKLIDAYRSTNPEVQIIFSTCPTVPQDEWLGTDWTSRIRRYGNPLINSLAKMNKCPVIDIYTYSVDHPEMFEGGDGLHPQNEQYKILAQGIYDHIKDIIKQ